MPNPITKQDLQKLMTRSECADVVGVRADTITLMVQAGRFPDPIIDLPRLIRWNPQHVHRFLETGKVR